MKKLFLLSLLSVVFACSSSSSEGTGAVTSVNEIMGQWKLQGTFANGSSTNIATECELQYGEISFSTDAVDKKGFLNTTCSQQSYTYPDYNIVDGQLRMYRNNTETRYYVKVNGDILSLTKFWYQASTGDPVVLATADQKTNKYLYQ